MRDDNAALAASAFGQLLAPTVALLDGRPADAEWLIADTVANDASAAVMSAPAAIRIVLASQATEVDPDWVTNEFALAARQLPADAGRFGALCLLEAVKPATPPLWGEELLGHAPAESVMWGAVGGMWFSVSSTAHHNGVDPVTAARQLCAAVAAARF